MDELYFKLMDGAFGRNGAGPFAFERYNPLIEDGFERDAGISVHLARPPDDRWQRAVDELGLVGQLGTSSIYVASFGAAVKPYAGLVEFCRTNFSKGIYAYCCPTPRRDYSNGVTIPLFIDGHAITVFQRAPNDRHKWISMELLAAVRGMLINSLWKRMGSRQTEFGTLIGRALKNQSVPVNAFVSMCRDYLDSERSGQNEFETNPLVRPLVHYGNTSDVTELREFFANLFERSTLETLSWQAQANLRR